MPEGEYLDVVFESRSLAWTISNKGLRLVLTAALACMFKNISFYRSKLRHEEAQLLLPSLWQAPRLGALFDTVLDDFGTWGCLQIKFLGWMNLQSPRIGCCNCCALPHAPPCTTLMTFPMAYCIKLVFFPKFVNLNHSVSFSSLIVTIVWHLFWSCYLLAMELASSVCRIAALNP